MKITEYEDRLDSPIGIAHTELMNEDRRKETETQINAFKTLHNTETPCIELICRAQLLNDNCAEACPIAGYCKEGCFNGHCTQEAEQSAKEIIMRGYLIGRMMYL